MALHLKTRPVSLPGVHDTQTVNGVLTCVNSFTVFLSSSQREVFSFSRLVTRACCCLSRDSNFVLSKQKRSASDEDKNWLFVLSEPRHCKGKQQFLLSLQRPCASLIQQLRTNKESAHHKSKGSTHH